MNTTRRIRSPCSVKRRHIVACRVLLSNRARSDLTFSCRQPQIKQITHNMQYALAVRAYSTLYVATSIITITHICESAKCQGSAVHRTGSLIPRSAPATLSVMIHQHACIPQSLSCAHVQSHHLDSPDYIINTKVYCYYGGARLFMIVS